MPRCRQQFANLGRTSIERSFYMQIIRMHSFNINTVKTWESNSPKKVCSYITKTSKTDLRIVGGNLANWAPLLVWVVNYWDYWRHRNISHETGCYKSSNHRKFGVLSGHQFPGKQLEYNKWRYHTLFPNFTLIWLVQCWNSPRLSF